MRRWPLAIRLIHWATALLVLATIPAAYAAQALTETDTDRAEAIISLHILAGLTIAVLTLARLATRAVTRRPPSATGSLALRLAASLGTVLLYALLLALPATGILKLTLSGLDVSAFGVTLIRSGEAAPSLARALSAWHAGLAKALIALALAHAATAVLHRRLLGSPVLGRMAFGRAAATPGLPR